MLPQGFGDGLFNPQPRQPPRPGREVIRIRRRPTAAEQAAALATRAQVDAWNEQLRNMARAQDEEMRARGMPLNIYPPPEIHENLGFTMDDYHRTEALMRRAMRRIYELEGPYRTFTIDDSSQAIA